ncbi:histone demethylase [Aureococcus anophagefferens]|nr:histone demethylase [Aureococcus anophagefferens]
MDASHSSGGQSRAALKRKKKHKNKAKQQQQPLVRAGDARALDPKREKKRAKLEAKAARAERRAADPEAPDGAVLGVVDASADLRAALRRRAGGLEDGDSAARRALRALLAPVGARTFYGEYFEKKALHTEGATVRLRCPADSNERVHALCRCLEDEFGSTVGANSYLTPGGAAQGFAAHWDDVDVFVLQTEGSKTWQIFAPDADDLKLPRVSSQDFDDEALDALYGTLRAEVTLDPGDVLYLPRGFVHRAATGAAPSLHVTLSAHRANAWIDLLERLLPKALESAQRGDCGLRKALRDYAHFLGVAHAGDDGDDDDEPADDDDDDDDGDDDDDDGSVAEVAAVAYDGEIPARSRRRRADFQREAAAKLKEVLAHALAALDDAADDLAADFVAEKLPPPTPARAPRSRRRASAGDRRDAALPRARRPRLALPRARTRSSTARGRRVPRVRGRRRARSAPRAHPRARVSSLPHDGGDEPRRRRRAASRASSSPRTTAAATTGTATTGDE